jgi:CRP/FNR family transcriptional regulator, cyclic AMP receptor protein
MFNR